MIMPDQASDQPSDLTSNIILCGFMGTGKTTVGRAIAAALGWQFADTDQLIESRTGKTISQIFWSDGESHFRQLESEICVELGSWQHYVVATGGGIVLRPENRDALAKAGLVICLDAPPEVIVARLADASDRPLLAGGNPVLRIRELMAARFLAYNALPHHIDTTNQTPEQLASQIILLWKRVRQAT
jgi:shikimate kinase